MAERGAASIILALSDGGINIVHREAGIVLHSYPQIIEGTWELMFDTIVNLLEEGMANEEKNYSTSERA